MQKCPPDRSDGLSRLHHHRLTSTKTDQSQQHFFPSTATAAHGAPQRQASHFARRPTIEAGRVLLTSHAVHHLEAFWTVEPAGNLSFGGGRLIPLAAVHPRAVAMPTWRNPEVLSRSAKWVPRPELEDLLSERLAEPIVRLIGPLGVGKTRLAWEVMRASGEPAIWRNAALARLQNGSMMAPLVGELAAEPARPVWIVYDHLDTAPPQIWSEIEELQKHPRLGDE